MTHFVVRDDDQDDGQGGDPGDGSLFRRYFPKDPGWGSVKRDPPPLRRPQPPAQPAPQRLSPLRNTADALQGVRHATAYYDSRVLEPVLRSLPERTRQRILETANGDREVLARETARYVEGLKDRDFESLFGRPSQFRGGRNG